MSQIQVYDFLNKNKGKCFTIPEIAKELNLNYRTTQHNVAQMIKYDNIKVLY